MPTAASASRTQVRPFVRSDRDQLTFLVNAHLAAVTPGASVSVQGLLSQLEREPGEFLVDPWVAERITLVAEQRHRIVAAAHLLRYRDSVEVGEHYRGTGEIRWLVCLRADPVWPEADAAGVALMDSCLAQLDAWPVRTSYADGGLPGPGVYGVPEQWPHVLALYEAAGFATERTETVLIAKTDDLLRLEGPAPEALTGRRTLGAAGTRFTGYQDGIELGYLEVDTNLGEAGRYARGAGLADVGNLYVNEGYRRRGIATWLLGQAARWLDLGGIGRLLTYVSEDDHSEAAFWAAVGFQPLTTTRRLAGRAHVGSATPHS